MMDYLSFGYAFAIAAGGLYGYTKTGSTASLTAGMVFGGLSALGAFYTSKDPENCVLIFVTCCSLGGIMTFRAIKSGKIMPAGLVATLSIFMVLRFLPRIVEKFHCDETSCERSCLYGHRLTEHGCITCACYNPCMVRVCPERMACDVNITSCAKFPCSYETFCYPRCPIIECDKACQKYKIDQFSCQGCDCEEELDADSDVFSVQSSYDYPL